ncbi:MAG: hypothetical protein HYZ10_08690 [Ignavibacteriales bacterium]|nr:MAG: hypothetical protein FD122_2111 [Stygiobacter sp.]KAF0215386.1 MAG: hypothetical protein FD178_1755 [Ignavibacteria bacterium]MBI3124469.1 hypothetical protein [Ignavibacteriales bacterium]OGU67256.1 MAG: hypothetical protein A2X62_14840 [Stygiobacter sp. GWC2_38_9]OGV06253.1 MAG: hypothetical protein A2299_12530 [Stygiobacter sp. RIFOXYB2_FULL_37_11]OGV14354.1 MAG: hypothetical protein A2237_13050 [Stygiobacter sp. RIFOXYA2_FULL_38_8]OGV16004.1 MAG: hypothetical protein A2440_03460 [
MVLDLIVTKTDDGFSTNVPSIHGCESWAHEEEEAITKTVELLKYYLQRPNLKIKIDLARRESPDLIYKLIFDKG